jgi:nicotinamidase-related amidase
MGVESTARQAYEHGYEVVTAEDATTSRSAEMHAFSVFEIARRIERNPELGQDAVGSRADTTPSAIRIKAN